MSKRKRLSKRKLRKKRFFIFLTCVFVLIGAVVFTINSRGTTTAIKTDEKYTQVEIIHTSNEENGFTAEYPYFHIKEIDQAIQKYLKSTTASFTNEHGDEQLTITYEIVHYSKQTVSVIFTETITAQNSEEATDTYLLNFDLEDGSIIQLEDLFNSEKPDEYLSILSDIAYAKLKNSALSNKEIEEATSSDSGIFQQFTLLNNAIVFHLNLGENIADTQLIISKDLFKDFLKEKYVLADLNKDSTEEFDPPEMITELPEKVIHISPDQKVIALTFDDGPKKGTTDIILEALKNYDAHATFFVLGNMAVRNPQLVEEIVENGNDIGSHSWDHPLLTKLNNADLLKQIEQTNSLIKDLTGKEVSLFRPPYGAYDERVTNYLGDAKITLWDIDTEDWKYRNKEHIVQAVMSEASDGRIVLMHDIYQTSAEAAVEIIQQLTAQDYKIVSVSELLEIKKQRELAS